MIACPVENRNHKKILLRSSALRGRARCGCGLGRSESRQEIGLSVCPIVYPPGSGSRDGGGANRRQRKVAAARRVALTIAGVALLGALGVLTQHLLVPPRDHMVGEDLRADEFSDEQLRTWINEVGWESLLNRRGTTWRKLPETDKEGVDEAKAATLMRKQPAMIKRPVFETGSGIVVGFRAYEMGALKSAC